MGDVETFVLHRWTRRLNDHLARHPATTLTRPGRWGSALAEHDALLAAIETQHPAEAADRAALVSAAVSLELPGW